MNFLNFDHIFEAKIIICGWFGEFYWNNYGQYVLKLQKIWQWHVFWCFLGRQDFLTGFFLGWHVFLLFILRWQAYLAVCILRWHFSSGVSFSSVNLGVANFFLQFIFPMACFSVHFSGGVYLAVVCFSGVLYFLVVFIFMVACFSRVFLWWLVYPVVCILWWYVFSGGVYFIVVCFPGDVYFTVVLFSGGMFF